MSATGSIPGVILIMDDDPDVLVAMERIVARLGRQVLVASTATEALAMCRAGSPPVDVVVADLGAAGPHVAGEAPRVIYVSGLTRAAAERQGLIGTDDVLIVKPFTAAELRARVTQALVRP